MGDTWVCPITVKIDKRKTYIRAGWIAKQWRRMYKQNLASIRVMFHCLTLPPPHIPGFTMTKTLFHTKWPRIATRMLIVLLCHNCRNRIVLRLETSVSSVSVLFCHCIRWPHHVVSPYFYIYLIETETHCFVLHANMRNTSSWNVHDLWFRQENLREDNRRLIFL